MHDLTMVNSVVDIRWNYSCLCTYPCSHSIETTGSNDHRDPATRHGNTSCTHTVWPTRVPLHSHTTFYALSHLLHAGNSARRWKRRVNYTTDGVANAPARDDL